jgi:putative transposase
MIDPEHGLPIQKQAEVLEISRSTVYYEPRPISDEDLWLMRRIDELHLNYPFAGSRMLRGLLWQQNLEVGRRHIKTIDPYRDCPGARRVACPRTSCRGSFDRAV